MITQEFDLNLIPNQAPVVVHVDQYDHGEGRLVANLYNGDTAYAPDGTVVIQGTKPDGHGFTYSAALEGNVVTADLTEQMAAVAGDVRTQIVVTESTGRTGTFAFVLKVQKSALPDDTDMSESDYQFIEEAIYLTSRAVTDSQDWAMVSQGHVAAAANYSRVSEAWAKGTKNGTPVPSTDETHHNNSKYWAAKSQEYAVGALHFKASVAFANIPTTGMVVGDMYNITDAFTTDSRFEEGAGIAVPAGANIAWSPNDKWDLLATAVSGGGVTSFKGRTGAVVPAAYDYEASQIHFTTPTGTAAYTDAQSAIVAGGGLWCPMVSCLVGDTAVTITNANIVTGCVVRPYSQTASGKPVGFSQIAVTSGQAVITFSSALTEAADILVQILK